MLALSAEDSFCNLVGHEFGRHERVLCLLEGLLDPVLRKGCRNPVGVNGRRLDEWGVVAVLKFLVEA